MSVTVGDLEITQLQELPFSHGGDAMTGQTARRWPIKALLTPVDWLTLDGIYRDWRDLRINDQDTLVSAEVGTTILTSGDEWGMTWANVPAWFSAPPVPTPAGAYVSVSFELVDAAEQLAVMLRQRELTTETEQEDNEYLYGTYSIGGVELSLTGQPFDYEDSPTAELAATGTHVIRGPLYASRVLRIQGWTTTTNAAETIREWYEDQILGTPGVGDYWPISPPAVTQSAVIVAGVKATRYEVSIDLKQIR